MINDHIEYLKKLIVSKQAFGQDKEGDDYLSSRFGWTFETGDRTAIHFIRNSDISIIQSVFKNLTEIEELVLDDMPYLTTISSDIQQLHKLKYFGLANVGFSTLPDSMAEMDSIEILEIFSCENFTHLPRFVQDWKNLLKITIENCPNLVWLPPGLTNLKKLDFNELLNNLAEQGLSRLDSQYFPEYKFIENYTDFPEKITIEIVEKIFNSYDKTLQWRLWTRFGPQLIQMQPSLSDDINNWINSKL